MKGIDDVKLLLTLGIRGLIYLALQLFFIVFISKEKTGFDLELKEFMIEPMNRYEDSDQRKEKSIEFNTRGTHSTFIPTSLRLFCSFTEFPIPRDYI